MPLMPEPDPLFSEILDLFVLSSEKNREEKN
jgi:hypothetical protein